MNNATPPQPSRNTSLTFRKANNVLLVVLVVINLYVIAVPFMPQLLFRVEQGQGKQQELEKLLQEPVVASDDASTPPPPPPTPPGANNPTPTTSGNRLVAPAMLLDRRIVEGNNARRALAQGIWRWPGGSTPDKGGNTVLAAHRFTYTQPKGPFYFLDKLQQGDTVGVVWYGKTYVYQVATVQTVPPTQVSILDSTAKPTLTMYTCTPLWLPKDRLVVTATLESIDGVRQ